jgi:ureidoglycolate dehydrogenase (NAD+)
MAITIDPPKNSTLRNVDFTKLRDFTTDAFIRAGLSKKDAIVAADVLATTDAWGVFTHGTKLVRGYLRRLRAGGLVPQAQPEIAAEGPAWAVVDGNCALAMITSTFAMNTAIAKAKTAGIAFVTVRNSCHFGAAGYYSWLAAQSGMVGLSMANDIPSVAAPGSRGAITGSNPIAYAIPGGRYPAILLDMSVATVAGGKVYAARTRGEKIPPTWLVGSDGKPTTDPSGYPESGALQPAAGHKGYGIALLIESLSGLISGAEFTWRVGSWMWDDGTKPTNHGAAFIAIDVNAMMPLNKFTQRVETLIDEIHNSARADGVDRLYVPGEMEWERLNKAMKAGIALPLDVRDSLREAGAMVGLDFEDVVA